MAGDWIKMRSDLLRSPRVAQMVSALKEDRFRIAGGLLSVWSLFDAHSEDGRLKGYDLKMLDDLAAWSGFSAAMILVGWLEKDGDTLVMPRFEDHNGASAKRRIQDADRKRKSRQIAAGNAPKSVTRGREEKIREENISTTGTTVPVVEVAPNKPNKPKVESPVYINIQTIRFETEGEEVGITVAQVEDWEKVYQGVNVRYMLGRIQSWSKNNPKKRKTKAGMNKFIDAWLARTQNEGGSNGAYQSINRGGSKPSGLPHDDTSWADGLLSSEPPASSRADQPDFQGIEGDFHRVGSGDQRS